MSEPGAVWIQGNTITVDRYQVRSIQIISVGDYCQIRNCIIGDLPLPVIEEDTK